MQDLYDWVNPRNQKHSPMISEGTYKLIMDNADVGEKMGMVEVI